MRKKKIKIPIYFCSVTMVLDKDFSYIEKKYNTDSLSDYGAITLKDTKKKGHFVVAFTDSKSLEYVAHEIVHLKNFIYLECSVQLDRINDEPEAYLTGWLFKKIYNFLKNNNHEQKTKTTEKRI